MPLLMFSTAVPKGLFINDNIILKVVLISHVTVFACVVLLAHVRTMSRCLESLQLEVGPQRAPILLVSKFFVNT